MQKIFGRTVFMLAFYWLGLAAGLSATAEDNDLPIRTEAQAIQCSAAIDVLGRTAPLWAEQSDIIAAKAYWDSRISSHSSDGTSSVDGEYAQEVSTLLKAFSKNPSDFARLAVSCASEATQPTMAG